jgi:hypothetical protein
MWKPEHRLASDSRWLDPSLYQPEHLRAQFARDPTMPNGALHTARQGGVETEGTHSAGLSARGAGLELAHLELKARPIDA